MNVTNWMYIYCISSIKTYYFEEYFNILTFNLIYIQVHKEPIQIVNHKKFQRTNSNCRPQKFQSTIHTKIPSPIYIENATFQLTLNFRIIFITICLFNICSCTFQITPYNSRYGIFNPKEMIIHSAKTSKTHQIRNTWKS